MNVTQLSLGDLAGNFLLRRQNAALKQSLTRLTNEVTTGRAQDSVSHLAGRLSTLSALERDLDLIGAHRLAVSEAGVQATSMQAALGQVHDSVAGLAETVGMASLVPGSAGRDSVTVVARQTLGTMLSSLNTQVAGRSLFAGTDIAAQPLQDADTLQEALRASLAGLTTAEDIMSAADAFFDTEGGVFDTDIYQGADTNLAPFVLGGGQTVRLDIRADDPALKSAIKTAAVTSLIEDMAPNLASNEVENLFDAVTGRAIGDQDRLTRLRGELGFAEQRIDIRHVELASMKSNTEQARNDLLSVDMYQSATELESVQQQLETLYTLTARSARLSLVNFLS